MTKTLALLACFFFVAAAQDKSVTAPPEAARDPRAEYLMQWDDMSGKFVALAEAIPQEKYSWRPGEGVRSVGEVYKHVANGNFWFMTAAGIAVPEGIDTKKIDSLKSKAEIIQVLKQSFKHVHDSFAHTLDGDFGKQVKFMGRPSTVREIFFLIATHQPEHLGQSIAYARMIGVVPPWTVERQAGRK